MEPITPVSPGPGQESVWDYPRPPRVEPSAQHVVVEFHGEVIADSRSTVRVLETSHPPVYYIPPEDVRLEFLLAETQTSFCEFKGIARYFGVEVNGRRADGVAWCYPEPMPGYETIAHAIAFYPGRVDRATVDGETVRPQRGTFYGGWVTDAVVGPFKGEPGTSGW
jgi:uncharacterized protein (DUF427 family)